MGNHKNPWFQSPPTREMSEVPAIPLGISLGIDQGKLCKFPHLSQKNKKYLRRFSPTKLNFSTCSSEKFDTLKCL
jgi:hypothetical protein